ncbi:hypothetical protein Ctob_009464 [Chrysochromulina tobinii]|uniref:Uncharacterized protein n=1 Tax=Chrysochromulina tobinii TaxID=1460289 RepID=A0A0M0JF28_9EUKA|nr:hypothetical protein Ctob_009464 [Chrysochromulina tobinii]|eukprot:KOO25206.1 hypothetical protein Ctob_009464 [Chrysochromulina sp. CCMP291]
MPRARPRPRQALHGAVGPHRLAVTGASYGLAATATAGSAAGSSSGAGQSTSSEPETLTLSVPPLAITSESALLQAVADSQCQIHELLTLLQAEREARLSSERRVEHLSRRIIGLEATTHAMSKVTALLPRLEQALDSQLVITPGTAPTSAMAPAGPAVNRARTPSLAANRAASEAVALANDLGAMRLVLSLDETLGSILSHLDSRSVSWLAPVAHVWAAASRGVLLERRLLFVFGSIDVFASALLRPNDGGCRFGSEQPRGGRARHHAPLQRSAGQWAPP